MKARNFITCAAILAGMALNVAWAKADQIRTLALPNNDLAYDPVSGDLLASVPSSAGAPYGNSIARVNTTSATVSGSVFVGSEPAKVALSANGQYLYVALDGAASVRRVALPTLQADILFSLGNGSFGPHYVDDMEVMPGNPDTIAVSRRFLGVSPRHAGVAIYDNGVVRPTTTPTHTGANQIVFGNDAARLYGYNNETTEFGFRRMNISPAGISTLDTTGNLISGFNVTMKYAAGRVFSTTGRAIDPEQRILLGSYAASGPMEPDGLNQRVFFLTGSGSTRTINAFNMNTFLSVGTLNVPGVNGNISSFVRWGSDGLAFGTTSGQVFLINTTLVPEPGSILMLLMGAAIVLRRPSRGTRD